MTTPEHFFARLALEEAVLVVVQATRGSVPRGEGAWMAVFAQGAVGTVGGGHLELAATAQAREQLRGGVRELVLRYPLGPALGQCCGGEVNLRFERVRSDDVDSLRARLAIRRYPVALFGGGHVGQAFFAQRFLDKRLYLAAAFAYQSDDDHVGFGETGQHA